MTRDEKKEAKRRQCISELSARTSRGQHRASTESIELCKWDPTHPDMLSDSIQKMDSMSVHGLQQASKDRVGWV